MSNIHARLLVAQSDRVTVALLDELLGDKGVELMVVAGVDEVVDAMHRARPDLVVLNCASGVQRVLEICADIRTDPLLCDSQILVLTSIDEREARLALLSAGTEVLLKPFDLEDLVLRVQNSLRIGRTHIGICGMDVFRAVSEQIGRGVIMVDGRQRMIHANQIARSTYLLDMACERDWIAQLDASFSLCCRGEWLALREGRIPQTHLLFFEKSHRSVPSTSVRWYKCLLFPIHGDPAGRCVVSLEDISKIVEVQDAMLGVKRFVNHRIRTVLNGLLGAVDLLVDPGEEDERRMAADLAQSSAHELAQVIDGLDEHFLASTCIDNDEKARVGDICAIVSTCSQAFMIATPLVECSADSAQRLPIGTGRMGAIISELMDNSVKFHPWHRPKMRFFVSSLPRTVRIVVEDDGGTLSKEQMKLLRIPFRVTNQSVAEEISGPGLGLSQVSRVVLGAGGNIEYGNREDGPGVRVTMSFPTTDG